MLVTAYVAVKGAYQAATFEARVEERNVVYVAPLLFVGARAVRGDPGHPRSGRSRWRRRWPPGRSVAAAPPRTGLEGDAPGLAILSRLANDHELDGRRDAPAAVRCSSPPPSSSASPRSSCAAGSVASWIVVGAAVLSIGWATWAETVASKYSNDFSELFLTGLPKPLDWVDQATGGKPAVYIGQKIADPNAIWSMEFWNRDVRKVWSLDGTAPGPGPILTPSLLATDGRLLGDPGYELRRHRQRTSRSPARRCETSGLMRLVRISEPLRLRKSLAGVFQDGWIGSMTAVPSVVADYNRFDAPKEARDRLRDAVAEGVLRAQGPGQVLIEVGTIGARTSSGTESSAGSRSGAPGSSTAAPSGRSRSTTPGGPFHVKVTVDAAVPARRARSGELRAALLRRAAAAGFQHGGEADRPVRGSAAHRRPTQRLRVLARRSGPCPRRCQSVWRERNRWSITAA